ncbi:MAG: EAL domain-containing protein, partial [Sulfurovum sp.]|nr:EAL domain-containing protein [Sulfurovum sp.]
KLKTIFAEPFMINDIKMTVQTSVGIVIIEPKDSNVEEIIRHADIAMYQAKKNRHNHISYYDIELDNERKKLFTLQHDLVFAAENRQLELYLQPIVSIDNDHLIAAECLIRWEHPKFGLLSPQDFIPTATETGAISDITWWVLEEICKNIYRLKEKKVWRLSYISINIDAKQLLINHFVDKFLETLSQYHIKTGEIMIEITEQSLIDNFEGTQDIISVLKAHGINCAIDDFGIGYSSLSYLKKLSFDTLKIDREFIKDIQQRPDDITLIKTMLTIGREFNYNIVIEGIEDNVQKETLAKIDPKLTYQGFLFEKPIAFEAFIKKYVRAEPL